MGGPSELPPTPPARPPGAREMATYLAARVVPALASMGLTFLCIHTLSAEAYGVYSLTLLPASVAASLIGGLSAQAMLRYAHELAPRALQRGLVAFPLAASALVCPVVLAYLAWVPGWSVAAFVSVASIPLVALMDTRRSLFIARAQARPVFTMDVLRAAAALALAAGLFAWWGARAEVPLVAQWLAAAACLGWAGRRAVPHAVATAGPAPARRIDRPIDRLYIGYGLWFAAWMATVALFALAERSVVEAVSGIAASGRYAAQADVVNAIFAATGGALASSMMPSYLSMTEALHAPTLRRLLRLGMAGVAATAVLCIALGVVIARVGATAGAGRLSAALTSDPLTALTLVAAGAVWTAAGFVQKPLELRGQTKLTFAAVFASLLLFLAVAPFMGRALGPAGVAAAKLAAGGVFVLLARWVARAGRP